MILYGFNSVWLEPQNFVLTFLRKKVKQYLDSLVDSSQVSSMLAYEFNNNYIYNVSAVYSYAS